MDIKKQGQWAVRLSSSRLSRSLDLLGNRARRCGLPVADKLKRMAEELYDLGQFMDEFIDDEERGA